MAQSSTLQIRGQNPPKGSGTAAAGRSVRPGARQAVEGPVIRSGVHGSDRLLAMRLYRLDVLRARSRDLIEREIIALRRDLWEMSNDLKQSLVTLYQQSLQETRDENTSDMKKSTRSKSRPSIFMNNRKRPSYSDLDDDDKRRRAEMNEQSYLRLLERYKPHGFSRLPVGGAVDSLSPDVKMLQLQHRSHTTMLPARPGQNGPTKGDSAEPSEELFDLFVRMNTDSKLKVRSAETMSLSAQPKHVHLPSGLGSTTSLTAAKVGHDIGKSHERNEHLQNSQRSNGTSTDDAKTKTTQYVNCRQVSEQLNLKTSLGSKKKSTLKKKAIKQDESGKDEFDLDFLDKEMRRKLLKQFDRNRSPDNGGNGKTRSKVVVSMPKIIRDSQVSRRSSVLAKTGKKGANTDASSLVSMTSGGDDDTSSHQLPAITNNDT